MIQVGRLFADRYQIIREIGRGGMANVYLATDNFLDNRSVAVKVLRPNFENDALAIARFQREAYAMSELAHPNIVGILDVGDYEGQQFIVMEYVEGITLKQYIKRNAPLGNSDAVEKASGVLSAMAVAHNRGIIHRDIKPQNILISTTDEVKVTDFGIAKALGETSLTQTNSMFGSVHYLSPEQARGANATIQSDIYAIGIILYEMLTGRVPYDGDSAVSIALKHFQEQLPSIINQNNQVPQALENVVIRATAKNIKYRYVSAIEMMSDLENSLSLDRRGEKKIILPKDDIGSVTRQPVMISDTQELIRQVSNSSKPVAEARPKTNNKPIGRPNRPNKTEVVSQNASEPKKKRFGLVIAIVLVFLALAAGGALTYALLNSGSNTVLVPSVAGQSQVSAQNSIEAAGLKIGQVHEENSDSVASGLVIKTDPNGDSSVSRNSKVDLYVSKGVGNISVPDVTNQSQATAENLLKSAGFTNIKVVNDNSDKVDSGNVISTDPAAGSSIAKNSAITLHVSSGAAKVTMPNVVGLSLSDAQAKLAASGFTNVTINNPTTTQDSTKDNQVYSASLATNSIVDPTTLIALSYYQYIAPVQPSSSSNQSSSSHSTSSSSSGSN
ncbi:Stk1 family PASTA domain-containing Ser/Thr kinase [Lactovum miscens]|uniref:non-specific serine/threonine protein kinase n=1 Tax=Lactovum miscens TaxID=190387 RepID=A0A841C7U4_9LACT|nr:Stk1 family PASTA domain-containing Ser/Thr kinase [Lactovum miscens]MBB5887469.1 serine/threonine-protein kinase [Lactovum miscens]